MYIVTGATGNVGSRVADILLDSGKPVRVIGRSYDRLKSFITKGAMPYVGDMGDADFLIKAFRGATAVFSMIPRDMRSENIRSHYNKISRSTEKALKESGITHVVNLSSVGAHLPAKTGPIVGLHEHEERLNNILGLNVVHLRAAYFMENIMYNVDLIKRQGINGSALRGDLPMYMIHTRDIATAAAGYLKDLNFSGKTVRYLLGERNLTMAEITEILGKAIGKPGLRYVQFSYPDTEKAMIEMGLSKDVAHSYVEMSRSLNDGILSKGIRRTPERTTETSIEEFAKEFARIYCVDNSECIASGF